MGEFRMPSLGADMEAGTIVEWRVAPGDVVHRGDIVADVETEKSTLEVEVFEDGVIEALLVDAGIEVPVGTPLATIGPATAPAPAPALPITPAPTNPAVTAPAPRAPAPPTRPAPLHAGRTVSPLVRRLAADRGVDLASLTGTGVSGTVTRHDVEAASRRNAPATPVAPRALGDRVPATPLARRRAREQGVDLHGVAGSGPAGAVVASDVAHVVGLGPAAVAVPPPTGEREPLTPTQRLRAALGALMSRSKHEIPHYYLASTIDLGPALQWMAAANEQRPVDRRLLPAALLLRATALAAAEHPAMNGHWVDGAFVPGVGVDLGVAVSRRGGGLLAPALRGAEDLPLDQLMERLRDLVGRARAGRLRGSEMADPTITVTNLGTQGVDAVFGVIYPPQVALVGFGTIADRPWVVDGTVVARPLVTVTLSADHRASDGHDGARFLSTIDRFLQRPEQL
jgi:pyruvate dehydrogenase E2 component (dihydrolipoamide acetyltransferase)